jgi:hypothetical protein
VGGVRHAVVNVRGDGVWAELGFEAGVHSVKRVPATETQGRIHTSTATVAVLPEPEAVEVTSTGRRTSRSTSPPRRARAGRTSTRSRPRCTCCTRRRASRCGCRRPRARRQNREKARRLLSRPRLRDRAGESRGGAVGRAARPDRDTGERSEKVRVYRYQDGIVADQRLTTKFQKASVLDGRARADDRGADGTGDGAEVEQETARRLAALAPARCPRRWAGRRITPGFSRCSTTSRRCVGSASPASRGGPSRRSGPTPTRSTGSQPRSTPRTPSGRPTPGRSMTPSGTAWSGTAAPRARITRTRSASSSITPTRTPCTTAASAPRCSHDSGRPRRRPTSSSSPATVRPEPPACVAALRSGL